MTATRNVAGGWTKLPICTCAYIAGRQAPDPDSAVPLPFAERETAVRLEPEIAPRNILSEAASGSRFAFKGLKPTANSLLSDVIRGAI